MAVALYEGDPLPDDRYEDWAAIRRNVACRPHLALLDELTRLYMARGEWALAIATLRRMVAEAPAGAGRGVVSGDPPVCTAERRAPA